MEILTGYAIIAIYGLLLVGIRYLIQRKYAANAQTIRQFIFAGGNISFGLLAPSIFVSWLWVTTVIGAAEAGVRYGISGSWAYSLGAAAAFCLLIPLIRAIRAKTPTSATFLEYTAQRFSPLLRDVYYLFAILLTIYLVVAQAAGIALVFNGLFAVSFKKIAFSAVIIAGCYVVVTGMRGVLFNELVNFFLISIGLSFFFVIIIQHFPLPLLHEGMLAVEHEITNPNYNPNSLRLFSKAGTLYGLSAIVIALGQICVDPAYYLKAYIAKDGPTMTRSFLAGGVLAWIPVPIISAFVLGYVALSQNLDFSTATNISINLSTTILSRYFGAPTEILFAVLIFCIGMTSIIHCLVGMQAIFTLDFYQRKIDPAADEAARMKFGKTVTLLLALLCALIAISLEKISLLTIDTFSGIFFAAPCSTIIVGLLSRRPFRQIALIAVVAGILAGLATWIWVNDDSVNWLYATLASFVTPIIVLLIFSPLTSKSNA
jgi:Na+/proline symporter